MVGSARWSASRGIKPKEEETATVNADIYQRQFIGLNDVYLPKRLTIAANRRKLILLHGNNRTHVARVVKDTMLQLEWEDLPRSAYSPKKRIFVTTCSDQCSTAWLARDFEMVKKCENWSMIGSLANQYR